VTIELGPTNPEEPDGPPPRRGGRQRRLVAGVAAAVALAAIVAVNLGTPPPPPPPPPVMELYGQLAWIEKLVDAPARGGLAADETFVREMTDEVTELIRARRYHPHLQAVDDQAHPDQEVKLLYADDVGDVRIVLLALRLPFPATEPTGYNPFRELPGRTKVVWLTGPRGAPASSLATVFTERPPPGMLVGSTWAYPLLVAVAGDNTGGGWSFGCAPGAECTMVALTPPGCTFATAVEYDPTNFRPEPTDSYLVRTVHTYRLEFWRVTCDGVVREERLAPPMWEPRPPSSAEIVDALAGSIGLTAEQQASEEVLGQAAMTIDYIHHLSGVPTTGPPRVLWAGMPPEQDLISAGISPEAGPVLAMVAVAPSVRSTWLAGYTVYQKRPDGDIAAGDVFRLPSDPTAPDGMIAVKLAYSITEILVIAPATATTVRLVDSGGAIIAESSLVDRSAFLRPPSGLGPDRLSTTEVVAVDATGATVATTVLPTPAIYDHITDWA